VAAKADARRSGLRLTEKGGALLRRFETAKQALLAEPFDDWSDADLADFARFATIARPDPS
jgi:DNA-binding MarR family transcriptional regulator